MRLSIYDANSGWLDSYADIASKQAGIGFDQTPEWFAAYLSHVVSASDRTHMLVVSDEEGLPALALPVLADVRGRLSIKCIEALSNYYTSLYEPIALGADEVKESAIFSFVSALGNADLAWDDITLEPMNQESLFYKVLCAALDKAGYAYLVDPCFVNWYLDVDGLDYATYEKTLPSKLRNTFKRKQRKLEREFGYTIRIGQDDNDLDKLISDYEAVYEKSWKSEESHPEFIRTIIKCFADKGWLRLGILYVEGKPAAAQLWFVKDGVASIYKLSYDGQYSKYSVGSILTAEMMRQVIDDDQVELVDFLTGDDAYKKDWMSHQQARYRIRIYNKKSWRGRVLALWNMKVKRMLGKS
ncbi:GNAT family N-acetyltransferase [Pseudomonadota bacterium]